MPDGPGGHDVARGAPRPGPLPARPGPARAARRPRSWPAHPHDAGVVPLRPHAAPARALAELAAPGQPRPGLRLLRQGGRVLPQAAEPSRCCCPRSPASTAARTATGATRTRTTWADGRWNQTDLGTVLCGVFRGAGVTVPKGVCVRLGDQRRAGRLLQPRDALLRGPLARRLRQVLGRPPRLPGRPDHGRHRRCRGPRARSPTQPFVYHGFYRHGKRVVFAYRIGDVEMLDAPWVEDGKFTRIVAPADEASAGRA